MTVAVRHSGSMRQAKICGRQGWTLQTWAAMIALGFQATTYAHCPSGGFSTLLDYGPFLTDTSLNNVPPGSVGMSGEKRLRGMNVTWQIGRNPSLISAATAPMAAITDALGLADWGLVAAKIATERGSFTILVSTRLSDHCPCISTGHSCEVLAFLLSHAE
jgi:hypothetical protein